MNSIARFVTRFSKLTIAISAILVSLSAVFGLGVFSNLQAGGYDDPNSESSKVTSILETNFHQSAPELTLIVDFHQNVDQPDSTELAASLVSDLEQIKGVKTVDNYYTANRNPALRSTNQQQVYFFIHLTKGAANNDAFKQIEKQFSGAYQSATIYITGMKATTSEINDVISSDLTFAESIAIPVTIILLLFVFGSLVSAGLPLIVAACSIICSFFCIWVVSQFSDVSIFGLNLITGLGLGLGIDYALLLVTRFREERAKGLSAEAATQNTVLSAGRTVLFSGVTVATVLVALIFFPQYFLKTFAYAGISVTLFSLVASLFTLPATLNLLGERVDKLKIRKVEKPVSDKGAWAFVAKAVMRRPLGILAIILISLGALAGLARGAQFGQVDDRILPATNKVVVANNQIRENFTGRESTPIEIIVEGASQADIEIFADAISLQNHIVRVQSTLGISVAGKTDYAAASLFSNYQYNEQQRIVAITNIDSRSTAGFDLITKLRAMPQIGSKVLIGGASAVYADSLLGVTNNLAPAISWIMVCTLILLFLFTGSVILPIKALLLNLLSLSATLGFITWVFQDGNLQWLTGPFQVTGTIDLSTMVLIAVVAFGLSMDYELFLLSRIKEQHDAGLNTTNSVSIGLQRSGKLITAAALVLALSFSAFITSNVSIMKMLGLGIAFAILLDAIVIRGLLVPALMKLFGEVNWWAPRWLKNIYHKIGLEH